MLAALGGTFAFNSPPSDIGGWTSDNLFIPSPPLDYQNGVSLAGSPPYAPPGSTPPSSEELRGGFSHVSPSTSPRSAYRLPVRPNNGYQSFGDYLGSSPGRGRPTSMPVQYPMAPPLPHHPQAHFYGVHEADLGLSRSRNTTRRLGSTRFCALDSLTSTGSGTLTTGENVLVVAIEHGIIIYSIDKDKLHILGRLDGIQGEVIGAKILPCQPRTDPYHQERPLIAVIVHGPAVFDEEISNRSRQSHDKSFDQSAPGIVVHSDNFRDIISATQYRTTVEVYSLRNQQHLTTIFKSPLVNSESNLDGPSPEVPMPIGNLSIQAKGRFLIVSSGTSGEVYIYEISSCGPGAQEPSFKCLGKYWTSIPLHKGRSYSSSSASSETESAYEGSPNRALHSDVPVVSLSRRWLVISPPASSSRSTLHGLVPEGIARGKPLSIKSHAPSAQFQVTCELDTPTEESLFNRVARDVTQEVMKSAKWVGDQGLQVWKNYWNKPSDQSTTPGFDMQPPGLQQPQQQRFPPTHANDDRNRPSNSPTVISIVDLEKLSESQLAKPGSATNYQPIATFSHPGGCSFVSFSPSGLSILTASGKGDVQYIWDLMRMVFGSAGVVPSLDSDNVKGPTIRQIARFTRMTVANIVEIVWTESRGERLAMVTDRGTVHIFDLPANAFQWPPPRRITRPATAAGQTVVTGPNSEKSEVFATAGGTFSAAVSMMSGRAQPLLAAVRGRPPSITSAIAGLGGFNITAGAAAGVGAKGSKVVASGISKSVGAATGTVNSFRHLGENRLHIPGAPHSTARGCVRWLSGKDRSVLAVVGNGIVRVHDVRQSINPKPGRRRPSVVGGHPTEFTIPVDTVISTSSNIVEGTAESLEGFWKPYPIHAARHTALRHTVHPLSFAEIETNAPYQPFHTDHRINLHVYTEGSDSVDDHHLRESPPWAFGEVISAVQITTGAASSSDRSESGRGESAPLGMENVVSLEGDGEGGRQVIVTTRRRKRGKGDTESEEGIFEDAAEWVEFADERV